jgi:amino acid efflux transporter
METTAELAPGAAGGAPAARPLSVPRGASLYVGALLGPGLLLLPGLAAAQAGPASIVAWLALIGLSALLAVVFTALGRAVPAGGGVAAYAAAGLGRRAGSAAGWCFLAGVVCGAPIVCLIGASYVTDLAGGGPLLRAAVAGALLLAVLGLAAAGVRASSAAQLGLVGLLIVVVVVAVIGSAPAARAANWAPFAPHGALAVGRAAATLMLSFAGWEAVAPLTARFARPDRELPRVTGIAFAVTTALYLGLAVATIACLGRGGGTDVPLARLLELAIGPAGRAAAAVAALVLTLGATNAYLTGATEMVTRLAAARATRPPGRPGPPGRAGKPRRGLLAVIGAAGLLLIGLYAAHLVSTAALVALPTTMFLCVYLACMASARRVLAGPARVAAVPAFAAVAAMLAFGGWALIAAAAVALAAAIAPPAAPPAAAPAGAGARSADDQDGRAAGDELADDRGARHLAGQQQAAGGLRVRQEQQVVLAGRAGVEVRGDPVQVAAAAAGQVARRQRRPGAADQGHGRPVDDRRDAGGAGQLVQVPEQAEPGDVGGAADPGGQRRPAGPVVQLGHHRDRLLADLPGRLVPGVEHAGAQRLGQGQRLPGPAGVDPQQRVRVGQPGDGHAVLGLGVVDAVPARDVAARRAGRVQAAAQHLGGQVRAQHLARPAEQVERDQRLAPDGVDVG